LHSKDSNRFFYGWVVVIACLLINTIIQGTRYSFGVFFKSLESDFELTRTVTSGVFSVYMVIYSAIALLGGWALDRYGPRIIVFLMGVFVSLSLMLTSQTSSSWQLYITYSLLLAIGTGASYTVLMATASRWFEQKRGLALGITSAGVGLGTVIIAPFAAYLINGPGWRWAYIIIGLIAGVTTVLLSLLLRKDPGEMGLLPDGVKPDFSRTMVPEENTGTPIESFSLRQASGTGVFWLILTALLLFSLCLHLVMTHLVPHATDVGISDVRAALLLSIIGVSGILGRLVVGWVSDGIGRKVSVVVCALLQFGVVMWLVWAQDLWALYLFAAVYGFAYGGFDTATFALASDIFGQNSLGIIMGALAIGWGIGAAIGPAVGGFIFDVGGSYTVAFLIGALAMVAATILIAFTGRGADGSV